MASAAMASPPSLTLAASTSTRDSGLLDHLLPRFEAATGISVRAMGVGTGRALELGRRGDVDALLVHDREAEEAFLREGHGSLRHEVMHNDFVLVGPPSDPAGVRGAPSLAEAFRRIARRHAPFLSRGDDSGTHKAELRIWATAALRPPSPSADWYRETGRGQGATLHAAAELARYALCDRGTWLAFRRREQLELLVADDPPLRNTYAILLVNPLRHSHAKIGPARELARWLLSPAGQAAIADFRVGGARAFLPNDRPSPRDGPISGGSPGPDSAHEARGVHG